MLGFEEQFSVRGNMQRRDFITLLGVTATTWPFTVRAQQPERMRRVGILLSAAQSDSEYPTLVNSFLQELQLLGWTDGRNLQIETRWGAGDAERVRGYAAELAGYAPDVILAPGGATVGPLLQVTRTVPVVFTIVPDPVGAGFVDSLARPGGNATGVMSFEYGMGGKWLELLKGLTPSVTRVAVIRDTINTAGIGQFGAIQSVAPSIGIEVSPLSARDASDIERAITAFALSASGGLIVTSGASSVRHRDLIIMLAARYNLPAVYYSREFAVRGGLLSYGPDRIDQFRRAASYVDRILRGEKPADLPVQAPTKYELVINLKTAKTLGLTVPPSLLATANEVIE